MPKVILIDDEENARITLSALLKEYVPDIEIVAQCSNVPEGVLAINKYNPDIVFLDVEMPEYNGFELIDFFKEITFEIIFVSAYSQYALKAFEVSAIDYILKPVEIESLKSAVEKAKKRINHESLSQRLILMKETYTGNEIQKIALPMSDGLLFVDIAKIVLFQADRSYTDVFLIDGSKLTVSKPLRIFEDVLNNRPFFFRAHRSYLINLHFISKYLRGDSVIIMENKINVMIARDRKNDFDNMLKELRISI